MAVGSPSLARRFGFVLAARDEPAHSGGRSRPGSDRAPAGADPHRGPRGRTWETAWTGCHPLGDDRYLGFLLPAVGQVYAIVVPGDRPDLRQRHDPLRIRPRWP